MMLQSGGNVGIETTSAATRMHVIGGTDEGLSGGGYIQFGSSTALNIGIDYNEMMARNNDSSAPPQFTNNGGNVLVSAAGTGRLGVGTSNTTGAPHVVSASTGDRCVPLPASSISAQETGDEPGVASNVSTNSSLFLTRNTRVIASRTLNVPTDGYVIAFASADLESGVTPGVYNPQLKIQTSTAIFSNADMSVTLPAIDKRNAAWSRVFPVTKGNNTLYILGKLNSSTFQVRVFDGSLTLLFVPTACGTVP